MIANLTDAIAYIEAKFSARLYLPVLIRRFCSLLDGDEGEDESRLPAAEPTVQEMDSFLMAVEKPRDALMFRMLFAGMLTNGELVSVQAAGFQPGHQRVFIGSRRAREDRYALLDPTTCELLSAWIWDRPLEEALFPMTLTGLWMRFEIWANACGLMQKYNDLGMRLSPNCFRRTVASACYGRGMEKTTLFALAGVSKYTVPDQLIQLKGIQLYAARYHAAREGAGGLSAGEARRSPVPGWALIARTTVVEYLRQQLPETAGLAEVLDTLCTLRLETMPEPDREWLREMGEELPLADQLGGVRLPFVPPVPDVLALCQALPVVQFLYRSGLNAGQRSQVASIDPETGIVTLSDRQVVVDLETAALVAAHPDVLTRPVEAVREQVLAAATRTGLVARLAAMGRQFGLPCLRHSYAAHLLEGGLDIGSLHALLGNKFKETTQMYTRVAVGRWLGDYMRCHPFAR